MDTSTLVVAGGVALGGIAVAALLAGLSYPFTHAGGDRNKDPAYAEWVGNICGGTKFLKCVAVCICSRFRLLAWRSTDACFACDHVA
jgi:hypothetical protein